MFSDSSPCLLGQHGSCSTAQQPGNSQKNSLQNLRNKWPPHPVLESRSLPEHLLAPLGGARARRGGGCGGEQLWRGPVAEVELLRQEPRGRRDLVVDGDGLVDLE